MAGVEKGKKGKMIKRRKEKKNFHIEVLRETIVCRSWRSGGEERLSDFGMVATRGCEALVLTWIFQLCRHFYSSSSPAASRKCLEGALCRETGLG